MNKLEEYVEMYGPIATPYELNSFFNCCSRQTGRTIGMVDNLPNDKRIAILTSASSCRRMIESLIRERREDISLNNILFLLYDKRGYWKDSLRGSHLPVYVADDMIYTIVADFVKYANFEYDLFRNTK